jgi:hypothetical protein
MLQKLAFGRLSATSGKQAFFITLKVVYLPTTLRVLQTIGFEAGLRLLLIDGTELANHRWNWALNQCHAH